MVLNKIIKENKVNDYLIETDTGWSEINSVLKTKVFRVFNIKFTNGFILKCADTHTLFKENFTEIFAKDLKIGDKIIIKNGLGRIQDLFYSDNYENMYDLELNDKNHRYFSNNILSHNTTTYSIFSLVTVCFNIDKTILIIANKSDTTKEIISRIKLAFELLPQWLKPGVNFWNKTSVEFSNGCKIETVSTSSDAARSKSANCLIIDECAFCPPQIMFDLWKSIYPIISSSKKSKCIMVSTPNGIGNLFYNCYQKGLSNSSSTDEIGWKSFRIDWWDVPGRDENWKKQTIASLNGDMTAFNQEFGNSFIGSSYTLFNIEKVEKRKSEIINKTYKIIKFNKYKINQYKEPEPGKCYSIGGDVSDGVGNDFSELVVLDITDPQNIEEVASFSDNTITPQEFSYVIVKLAILYNECPIMIESNNMGCTTLTYIYDIYEYDNIARVSQKNWGINCNSKTKLDACFEARKYVEHTNIKLNDIILLEQMSYFEKVITGRGFTYKANAGKNDDKVMAFIWAIYILDKDLVNYFFDCDSTTIGINIFPKNLKLFKEFINNSDNKDKKVDLIYETIKSNNVSNLNELKKDMLTNSEIVDEPLNIGFYS